LDRVLDHLFAAVVGDIQVDIGHGHPARVQETLKEQVVLERVQRRDVQRIGHDAARAGATHRHEDAVLSRIAAEVPDDEEIGVKAKPMDQVQLVIQALRDLSRDDAIAPFDTLLAQVAEVALGVISRRHIERGQVILGAVEIDMAALRDGQRVGQRLWDRGKKLGHLVGAAQIVIRRGHGHALGVIHGGAGLDGQQQLLGGSVLFADIVDIVGRHQAEIQLPAQGNQFGIDLVQLGHASMPLQLEVKVVLAKSVAMPDGRFAGLLPAPLRDQARDLARDAGRKKDDPLGILG